MADESEENNQAGPRQISGGLNHNYDAVDRQINEMAKRELEATRAIRIANSFQLAKVVGLFALIAGLFLILVALAIRLAFPPREKIDETLLHQHKQGELHQHSFQDHKHNPGELHNHSGGELHKHSGNQINNIEPSQIYPQSETGGYQFGNNEDLEEFNRFKSSPEYSDVTQAYQLYRDYQSSDENKEFQKYKDNFEELKNENPEFAEFIEATVLKSSQASQVAKNTEQLNKEASKKFGEDFEIANVKSDINIFQTVSISGIQGITDVMTGTRYNKATDTVDAGRFCYAMKLVNGVDVRVSLGKQESNGKPIKDNNLPGYNLSGSDFNKLYMKCNWQG